MSWLRDFERAFRRNVNTERVHRLASRGVAAPDRAAEVWKASVPYSFRGARGHRIKSFDECIRRGYGACGDACAFVGAAGFLAGRDVELCVEGVEGLKDYRHVRLIVDGHTLDPTAKYALPATHFDPQYTDMTCRTGGCLWKLPVSRFA